MIYQTMLLCSFLRETRAGVRAHLIDAWFRCIGIKRVVSARVQIDIRAVLSLAIDSDFGWLTPYLDSSMVTPSGPS